MKNKPIWSFLLLDPNPRSSKSIISLLAYYGYTVHAERDGMSGINHVHKNLRSTDLILLDDKINDIPQDKIILAFQKLNQNIPVILLLQEKRSKFSEQKWPQVVIGQIRRPLRTDRLLSLISRALGLG